MRLFPIFLGFLLLMANCNVVLAASQKAAELRQVNGLSVFSPPEKFLAGNFVADEMNPAFIFGTVQAFAASCKCPTTWLVEEGEKARLARQGDSGKPEEYTLYLEEDCPDKVVYYVFIDQSALTPQQWIEWREKFHKSKTGEQFGPTKSKLDTACKEGCEVGAELRFIQKDGELQTKPPEEVVSQDLKLVPIYDLNRQKKISQ